MVRTVKFEFWLDLGDLGECWSEITGESEPSISGGLSGTITSIRARIPLASGQEFFANVKVTPSTQESIEHEIGLRALQNSHESWDPDGVA